MFKATKSRRKTFSILFAALMAFAVVLAVSEAAFAAPGAMPWEAGLEKLKDSITGPVAQAIALIAIVAAGAALIFCGDMTGFMRTAVYIVLVLGIIIGAANLLSALGGTTP